MQNTKIVNVHVFYVNFLKTTVYLCTIFNDFQYNFVLHRLEFLVSVVHLKVKMLQ